ncbi:MAG: SIMPL domain-containing protein [Acidaminobacteraceae bacterium]
MNKLFKLSAVSILALSLVFGGVMSKSVDSSYAEDPSVTSVEVEKAVNKVTVNGAGTVTLKPDVAYINIGINTKDLVASVAQDANKEDMNKVIAALKKTGVKEDNITTENYSIYKQVDYDKETKIEYVNVNNTVKVKVKDLESIGNLIDVSADAGANSINSIRFEVEDKSTAYNKALRLAMTDAKGKAIAIMGTFGKMPGTPSSVNESSYSGGIFYENILSDVSAKTLSATTSISPKNIEVTANVSVEYNY